MIHRAIRHVVTGLLVFGSLIWSGRVSAAGPLDLPAPWPAGDVTVTLPFSPGSETDVFFALFRDAFVVSSGRTLTSRHVAGRAGANAWAKMVDDAPDGSVLTIVVLPDVYLRSLQPDSGVSLDNMTVCHIFAYTPCALWVLESGAFTSLGDLTDAARDKQGSLTIAGPGRYSTAQLANRALDRLTGTRTAYIPYVGSVEAAKAVASGKADAFWGTSMPVSIPGAPFKAVGAAAKNRVSAIGNAPTFAEQHIPLTEGVYYGIAVPLETQEITRQEIAAFFAAHAKSGTFLAKGAELGFVPQNITGESIPVFLKEIQAAAQQQAQAYNLNEQ